jgi:hypothetical protein
VTFEEEAYSLLEQARGAYNACHSGLKVILFLTLALIYI